MALITVKQVIPHPDGAAIIVPEDSSQRSFCLLKEQVEQLGGVSIEHLSMPGSAHYEQALAEAEGEQWVHNAPDPDVQEAEPAPEGQQERAVYQYVAAVATPNGFIHYDGILHGPMISGIEDYHRYRAEMASDAGVQPEQIQVRSLAIVGMAPLVPKNDG
jgi:hypothetical protein